MNEATVVLKNMCIFSSCVVILLLLLLLLFFVIYLVGKIFSLAAAAADYHHPNVGFASALSTLTSHGKKSSECEPWTSHTCGIYYLQYVRAYLFIYPNHWASCLLIPWSVYTIYGIRDSTDFHVRHIMDIHWRTRPLLLSPHSWLLTD